MVKINTNYFFFNDDITKKDLIWILFYHKVPLLLGREFTGSFDARSAAPAKLYSRVQLFCRTLGHLSAVYCVLFDRTGQYIFTVC
jgi:hypothetical protein